MVLAKSAGLSTPPGAAQSLSRRGWVVSATVQAMVSGIQRFIRTTDATVAGAYLSLFRERDALIPFLFHSLFADERQIELNHIDPLERTTVAQFRRLIEYFQKCGYRFVGAEEV